MTGLPEGAVAIGENDNVSDSVNSHFMLGGIRIYIFSSSETKYQKHMPLLTGSRPLT